MAFLDKLKSLSETYAMVEEKLGIRRFIQYSLFILAMYATFNFNSIVENIIKIQTEIKKKEHEERLSMRDGLMSELNPLLVELRSRSGASRVLYFEYHNSTENFVGIPFKFANLVLFNQAYGCPDFDVYNYRDINSGLISRIYGDLKKNEIIINKGRAEDIEFYTKYPEIHEFFSSKDGSVQQVFVNLPGVNFPVGMIVLEWVDENEKISSDSEWKRVTSVITDELPRINALISKYTP